jgi:hypothetical protein
MNTADCGHLLGIVILSEDFASLGSEAKPESKDLAHAGAIRGDSRDSYDAADAERVGRTPRQAAYSVSRVGILRLRERIRARSAQDDKTECWQLTPEN